MVRQPVHAASRRLRARHADHRGARGVRGAAARAHGDRRLGAGGRRDLPARRLPARRAARVRGAHPRDARLRRGCLAARSDRTPVLHVVHEPRRAADDAVPPGRPRVRVVDPARGRARALRARDRRLAPPDAARQRALARGQRVAEPDLGEPRGPQPALLGALVRAAPGDVPLVPARSTSTTSSARSTGPSRASSASTPTRRPTASTSSSASSSSRSCSRARWRSRSFRRCGTRA